VNTALVEAQRILKRLFSLSREAKRRRRTTKDRKFATVAKAVEGIKITVGRILIGLEQVQRSLRDMMQEFE